MPELQQKPIPTVAPDAGNQDRGLFVILVATALGYLFSSLLYNEIIIGIFDPQPPIGSETLARIRRAQLALALAGLVVALAAVGVAKSAQGRRIASNPVAQNLSLLLIAVIVPLSMAEIGFRPFVEYIRRTTIFIPDEELGWRLRPGSRDMWGGVEVGINNNGLRGPDVSYDKPDGVARILFLGDSVTFGYRIARDADTYPRQVQTILESRLGCEVESINSGVGGWSPWQQDAFLRVEGYRYQPDLVVIGFVLNDVTEKFDLERFGGTGTGTQLEFSVPPWRRWLDRSAIFMVARRVGARLRFGIDTDAGARGEERIRVLDLIHRPAAGEIEAAWTLTLRNLERIYTFSRDAGIHVLLVAFPYTVQFDSRGDAFGPQRRVQVHAALHGVPTVDAATVFLDATQNSVAVPADLFVDESHLNERGATLVASALATAIEHLDLPALSGCQQNPMQGSS